MNICFSFKKFIKSLPTDLSNRDIYEVSLWLLRSLTDEGQTCLGYILVLLQGNKTIEWNVEDSFIFSCKFLPALDCDREGHQGPL